MAIYGWTLIKEGIIITIVQDMRIYAHRRPSARSCLKYCLCLLSVFLVACDLLDPMEDNVAIIVGSSHITSEKLKNDMDFFASGIKMPVQHQEEIRGQIIEQCVNHYLIVEYGKINGIVISEKELQNALSDVRKQYSDAAFDEALLREYVDFAQWKNRLREQLLVDKIIEKTTNRITTPNYEEIRQCFESHPEEFKSPRMVEFRQIVTQSRKEAKNLLERVKNGEKLSELAGKHSKAPEAENDGKVGWVAEGHLDESMEEVLFSMKKGKISPVIETPYGYHIFEVLAIQSAGLKKLADVIPEIEGTLLREKRETFLKKWLQDLQNTFEVRINQEIVHRLEFS